MAFPKRHARKIRVEGIDYAWRIKGNSLYRGERHIVVRLAATPGQFLCVDPFHHDLEIRPDTIRRAVLEALKLSRSDTWLPPFARWFRLFSIYHCLGVLPIVLFFPPDARGEIDPVAGKKCNFPLTLV